MLIDVLLSIPAQSWFFLWISRLSRGIYPRDNATVATMSSAKITTSTQNTIFRLEPSASTSFSNRGCSTSRKFVRGLDATRELEVSRRCTDMGEAVRLMRERKVKGIVLIPEDFEDRLAATEQAGISVYADMSSFLYYKNLTAGVNLVMLDAMHEIQEARFSASGITGEQVSQLVSPVLYEENIPYNRNFSYNIFFLYEYADGSVLL